jgi:hypothetical protein
MKLTLQMPGVENIDLLGNYYILKHVTSVGMLPELFSQETSGGSCHLTIEIIVRGFS